MKLFKIKLANKSDIEDIFKLSNDSIVRENSFNSEFISWEEHVKWFNNKINNEECIYYVVKGNKNEFIGQVRFDRIENSKNYVVAISINKQFRGIGIGNEILRQTSCKLNYDFDVKNIYAYIKEENQSSVKCFLNAGYKVIGKKEIDNFPSYKMIYVC